MAQNVTISFGYLIFSKNHNELPKVAQLAKTVQSGHHSINMTILTERTNALAYFAWTSVTQEKVLHSMKVNVIKLFFRGH